jgi:hypothetical protein
MSPPVESAAAGTAHSRPSSVRFAKRHNAGGELLGKSASFLPVSSSALIMIEASPSAYPSGMLAVGKATH